MSLQDIDGCGDSISHRFKARPAQCLRRTQMDVAVALGITPVPVLHRRLHRSWTDVAKTLGIIPEPVLHRCVCRT